MTPEERIAETILSLSDCDRLHEWPTWRLEEVRSMLIGARMAATVYGRRAHLKPLYDACDVIESEMDTRAKLYE